MVPALSILVAALAGAMGSDDDAPIVIDETPVPGSAGAPGAAEDPIIILSDSDAPTVAPRPVGGALGRLWESWHVAADSQLFGAAQLAPADDGVFRGLASLWLESWLLPAPNLSLYANGFGRVAIDAAPGGRLVPFADFYEAYAKVNVDRAAITLGRLVVPWGRTQGAALGDRVSPPDLRRGEVFPDAAKLKQPAWGVGLRTSLGSVGVEGIALAQYEPTEGSLAASHQGGVRIAHYQTALVRSPPRAGGLLNDDDTTLLQEDYPLISSGVAGARAWRRVGDFDVSGSLVFGRDETPTLHLSPDVARALAAEALRERGAVVKDPSPCSGAPGLACVGGAGTIGHDRTTSVSFDVSWGLGVVIVRGEAVLYPQPLGGRSSILMDEQGLRSERLSQYGAVLAVEGALGDSFDGSLELFDIAWQGVPDHSLLYGVELFSADTAAERVVHRLAGAAALGGKLFSERVHWRLHGEAGILQPDVDASLELRYRLPVFNLYVGGRGDAFFGLAGSPGWMRQDASLVGIFLGEGS
jgi:hypothetical protein